MHRKYALLRLGLPFFTSAKTLNDAAIATIWDRVSGAPFQERPTIWTHRVRHLAAAVGVFSKSTWARRVLFVASLLMVPTSWTVRPVRELPGYERMKGFPPTRFDEWIQHLEGCSAFTLQAFALTAHVAAAGKIEFSSTRAAVISTAWMRGSPIPAVTTQCKPVLDADLVDPYLRSLITKPHMGDRMRAHRQSFREVFCDNGLSALEVRPAAIEALRAFVPPGDTARGRPSTRAGLEGAGVFFRRAVQLLAGLK